LGFKRLQAQNDGFDARLGQFVLLLQVVALTQQGLIRASAASGCRP
jgi:hypothetical protein